MVLRANITDGLLSFLVVCTKYSHDRNRIAHHPLLPACLPTYGLISQDVYSTRLSRCLCMVVDNTNNFVAVFLLLLAQYNSHPHSVHLFVASVAHLRGAEARPISPPNDSVRRQASQTRRIIVEP